MFSRRDLIKKLGIGGFISSFPAVSLAKPTIEHFDPVGPIRMQIPTKRKNVYAFNRMIVHDEPLVSAFIDYYVSFLIHRKKSSLIDEDLLKSIAREYLIIGDFFPFISLHCKKCKFSQCNCNIKVAHKIQLLNPDWVDVKMNPLDPSKPTISLISDDTLKQIVLNKDPMETYNSLPDYIKNKISLGEPILLNSKSAAHIKRTNSPYHPYGISF